MTGKILISTAYLPPIDYMSVIASSEAAVIEKEENYIKQTYRNRCYILSAHGPQLLTVPVFEGSRHKIKISEVRIDYSKRWQQVHLRAIMSSYKSSPYFDFYFEKIEKIILANHEFLLELNNALLEAVIQMLRIKPEILYSIDFMTITDNTSDFRYTIMPGKAAVTKLNKYIQVFDTGKGFEPNLSVIDLIFNQGPESRNYLQPA